MSSKPASHRVFFVFLLLAALILASLPAQARTVHRSPASRNSVAVSGDTVLSGIWRFVVSLWPGVVVKEGTSIDPDGNHTTSTTPTGDLIDEGMSIDPNGSK
ncbi:MAG TPA: hypothetical protein VGP73_02640 [Thermoanaerobaculia bacterium]